MQAKKPDNGGLENKDALKQRIEDPEEVVRRAFSELETHYDIDASEEATEEKSVYDRLKELGVIGCYDAPDSPGDLSTNEKHMEGFGCDEGPRSL